MKGGHNIAVAAPVRKCTEIRKWQSAHYGDYISRYVPVGPV